MEQGRAEGRHAGWRALALVTLMMALVVVAFAWTPAARGTTVPETPSPEAGEDGGASTEVVAELPPPDLPTTNEQGYTFQLLPSLNVDLDTVDQEAPIYELVRKPMSLQGAQQLADRLRIYARVEDRGDGGFAVSGTGQLFISPDVIQYVSQAEVRDGDLPTDEEAVAYAREWLRLNGLTPPDIGAATIASRAEESDRVVVVFTPVEPEQLLAAYPSITVTLGPMGTILEASIRWADIRRADVFRLRAVEDAWAQVQSGQGYIEADILEAEVPAGSEIKGTVTYNDVSIAYTTAGPPGGRQYLQPVFVFRGRVRLDDGEETYSIRAYVAALANSGAPVGSTLPAVVR
ncbi:MAG: hypothetical protein ACRDJH_16565 [Thermomicrobiales bacterium]